MSWAGRLAFASPIFLTVLWTAGVLLGGLQSLWPIMMAFGEIAFFMVPVIWSYAIYRICRQVLLKRREAVGRADWLFLLTIGIHLILMVAQAMTGSVEKSMAQGMAEWPLILGVYGSLGVAGRTLDRAERGETSTAFNRGLLNAVILFLAPVGVWVLKPRLAVLKAELSA